MRTDQYKIYFIWKTEKIDWKSNWTQPQGFVEQYKDLTLVSEFQKWEKEYEDEKYLKKYNGKPPKFGERHTPTDLRSRANSR